MKKKRTLTMGLVIKYETLIASGLIIVSVLVLSIFLLLPNILKVDQISKEKSMLADKINRLSNKKTLLADYNYDTKKQDFEKMQHILPNNADYISVIQTIDDLESKSGASIIKTDFKSPAKNLGPIASPSASFIWLSLSLEGRYDQLQTFLNGMNRMDGRIRSWLL
jgi:Tfp pilus assembly protein PilO